MRSSSAARPFALAAAILVAGGWSTSARAQQQAQGFALERLYPSAPGGGWFVMDALDMHGGLGGALSVTTGYAYKPLVVTDGTQHLGVVNHEAFANVGAAVTYERYRLYLNLASPLVVRGDSGTVGPYKLTAPRVDAGRNPDLVTDIRLGYDVRLTGGPRGPFRLGVGAQLMVPNGNRADYDTDDTFRAMVRVLFAGDLGPYAYAAQLGWHIRSLDDSPAPGSPQGSEMLFGAAAGRRFRVSPSGNVAVVVGPEIYGETAFQSFLGTTSTGLEGLLTGRLEGTADDGPQLRVKLGTGAGLNPHFGAPEWRLVFGIEVFDHHGDRDKDGVSDAKDACPDTPGVKTEDPQTNGCPAR